MDCIAGEQSLDLSRPKIVDEMRVDEMGADKMAQKYVQLNGSKDETGVNWALHQCMKEPYIYLDGMYIPQLMCLKYNPVSYLGNELNIFVAYVIADLI